MEDLQCKTRKSIITIKMKELKLMKMEKVRKMAIEKVIRTRKMISFMIKMGMRFLQSM